MSEPAEGLSQVKTDPAEESPVEQRDGGPIPPTEPKADGRLTRFARRLVSALATPLGGWVFLGLLVRLVLMPLTAHTDALIVPWPSRFLALGEPNVYDAMFELSGWKMIAPIPLAPYQPLYYAVTGAWLWLTDAIGWLSMAGWDGHWTLPHLERGLVLLKAVYLPFDLGVAALLALLVPAARRTVVVGLWMMCPVVIWVAYVMGQNDAMPTFFVVLALYAGTRALKHGDEGNEDSGDRWRVGAVLSLGVGAAFKLYPLLLVPVFALQLARSARSRIALLLLGVLPVLAVALPFIDSHAFRQGALLNIEATSMLGEPISIGSQTVSIFAIAYVVLLAILALRRQRATADTLWLTSLITLTLLFTTGQWAYNWLFWLMPFAVLAIARVDAAFWPYLVQVGYFLAYRLLWGQEPWLLHFSEQFFAPFGFRDLFGEGGSFGRMMVLATSLFVAASWGIVVLAYRRCIDRHDESDRRTVPGPRRWPWLIPVPLLLVAMVAAGLMYSTTRMIPGVTVSSEALEPASRLSGDAVLQQSFAADRRNLRAIRMRFGTYGQVPLDEVELRVLRSLASPLPSEASGDVDPTNQEPGGAPGSLLRSAVVDGRELTDNHPYTFTFDPIPASVGPLQFSLLSPEAPPEADLTVFRTAEDAYSEGSYYRNDDRRDGDIAFTAYHSADWSEAWSDLRMAIRADRGFFAVWASLCWGLAVLAAGAFAGWRSGVAKLGMVVAFAAGSGLIMVALDGAAPVRLGEELRYLGHYLPSRQAEPGTPLSVKLYWQSREPIDSDLTAFVHLRDASGQTVAQEDRPLRATIDPGLHRRAPVTSWLPGEVGVETYALWLAPDLPPGDYRLIVGVYDPETMDRLRPAEGIVDGDDPLGGEDAVALPTIRVGP